MLRFRLSALATLLVLCFASPAEAQSKGSDPFADDPFASPFDEPGVKGDPGRLEIDLLLNAAGHDTVKIYGVHELTEEESFDLARSVGDALGLDRKDYGVAHDFNSIDETFDARDIIRLELDGRLVERDGSDWTMELSTASLLRVARQYEYETLDLSLCPATEQFTTAQSTAPPSNPNDSEGCAVWQQAHGAAPITVAITESPNSDKYTRMVAIFIALGVALALIGLIAVIVSRAAGRLVSLNTASILWIAGLVFAAMFAWMIGLAVSGVLAGAVGEYVLDRGWGRIELFLATVLPPLFPALGLIAPAVLLARGRPYVPVPKSAYSPYGAPPGMQGGGPTPGSPGGAPSWMSPQAPSQPQPGQPPVSQPQPTGPGVPGWLQNTSPTPPQPAPPQPGLPPQPASQQPPVDLGKREQAPEPPTTAHQPPASLQPQAPQEPSNEAPKRDGDWSPPA